MPTSLDPRPDTHQTPHQRLPSLRSLLPVCLAVITVLCLCLIAGSDRPAAPPKEAPPPSAPPPAHTLFPAGVLPSPAPPEPTGPAAPLFDFSQPAPETPAVDGDYFSDAVFLGDSRTDGLRLYGGIRPEDVFFHNGLMIFEAADPECKLIKDADGALRSILDLLGEKQYAKVYTMFGINELGYGDDQGFYDTYAQFLDDVRQLQPDAILYVQSIIPVNEDIAKVHDGRAYVTNAKIADYNALLRQFCEEKQVIYLDLATALTDEDGILPAEGTTDGVHFRKAWYQKWYEYLTTHTVSTDCYTWVQDGGAS